ncbi:hypothetical protein A3B49_01635 [Candidatus Daviesbacteria bacterium RIFCSPLOWO2_01_FULL_40_24]|uniref:Uncharacterized protein n=1 Tax=Candidatus Daviesbacteria bacterium RIFCSPLOWO2_01_FULL_40_24 TaxID=1797787 RepID=A0A1F5MKC8_9BACT|nr:MAG: hypothetical protein A3B49_01635 [Candidatus Daviesbacteria bacterium RIFCSPLOWO2_01_FULL_40_24]
MAMKWIEGDNSRGLASYLNDADKAKAGLANLIIKANRTWRELYGEFSLPGSRLHSHLEGKASTKILGVGGKDPQRLLKEVDELKIAGRKVEIGSYARSMAESTEFEYLPERAQVDLVTAEVRDLTSTPNPTTAELIGTEKDTDEQGNPAPFTRGLMTKLDLNFVPHETAFEYLLQNGSKLQVGDVLWMAMRPITGSDGLPGVFGLVRPGIGAWLDSRWAGPDDWWHPEDRIVFSLRK